jgi:hypothetical protein
MLGVRLGVNRLLEPVAVRVVRTFGRTTSGHDSTGRFVRSMKEEDPNRVV